MSSYTKQWGSPGFSSGVYVDCTCGWSFSVADPRWKPMVHAQIRLHKKTCKQPLKPPPKKHEYSDTCFCFLCKNHRGRVAYLKANGLIETDVERSSSRGSHPANQSCR